MNRVDGRLADGRGVRLELDGGLVTGVTETGSTDGPLLLPGLVDLQVNGFAGLDVNADDVSVTAVTELTRALWSRGVTAYCPTIITAPADRIVATLRIIAEARAADPLVAHSIVGVHVEGPYLASDDGPRGAHDPRYLRDPDLAELQAWLDAAPGLLRIVTLAPELAGAEAYVRTATAAGVLVAIGHTAASPDQVRAGVAAGARLSTHLGNGTYAELPRHPNHLWAQLAADELTASLIADGHHLPADTFTAMVHALGNDRAVLVSDSAALAGCPPGEYRTPVGGSVTVDDAGRLRLTGTDLLAGSGSSLLDCVRWALGETPFGLEALWGMASRVPAGLVGLHGRGVVRAGAAADLVLATETDAGPEPVAVLVTGTEVTR